MESTPVEVLVERLLERPELWPELLDLDRDHFVERATVLAACWDIELTADDVLDAVADGRREWFSRWV